MTVRSKTAPTHLQCWTNFAERAAMLDCSKYAAACDGPTFVDMPACMPEQEPVAPADEQEPAAQAKQQSAAPAEQELGATAE